MTNTSPAVTYLGRCRCGVGHRLDLPRFETVTVVPGDVLDDLDRLVAAGEVADGFAARSAYLADKRVDVEVPTDRYETRRVECACGRHVAVKLLVARHSDHVCGSKCLTALGPSCECRCGGENHGRMYLPEEQAS